MIKDFKQFLLRGNVVDLAVGVVIGAAFGAIVTSLVKDVVTPLIATIGNQPDFSQLVWTINGSAIHYGNFLNALISFLIIAVVIFFFVVQPVNRLVARANRGKEHAPGTQNCPHCLSEIPAQAKRCAHCTSKLD
jgi:large conductance mechanosensitive channel